MYTNAQMDIKPNHCLCKTDHAHYNVCYLYHCRTPQMTIINLLQCSYKRFHFSIWLLGWLGFNDTFNTIQVILCF